MYKNIYEKIVKDSPIPYFLAKGIKDSYNEYIDLEILDANLSFSNMIGIDSSSLVNTILRDICEEKPLLNEINKSFKIDYNKDKTTYEVYDETLGKYFNVDIYMLGDDIFGIRLTEINKEKLILSNIIKNSPFSAWVKGIDGRYMDINDKFAYKSGKSYSEIIGKTDEALWPIKEAEKYRQEDINIMKTRKVDTYNEFVRYATEECRLYETTKWPYVDKNNNVLGTIGLSLEIVDNIELRKNLAENEENFKEIINYSEEVFFIVEKEKVSYISPSFGGIFGESPNDLIDDIHNLDKYINKDEIKEIDYSFKTSIDRTIKINDANGNEKWIWVKVVPIKDERGNIIKSIGIISDVSKRKEVEVELENMRMDFFANLSHELRTPINLILGTIQLLDLKVDKLNDIDKMYFKKYNKIVTQNGLRLLKLVNNLIDTTKIDAGYFEYNPINYDIINFVESICMSVCEFAKQKKVNLIFDTEIEENLMSFDLDMMERIILNLLSNAIKFNKKDGEIKVYIYQDSKENLNISIKDSGFGIPKEKLDSIFQRFEQVNSKKSNEKEGSGIGLALVKSLVELHDGDIFVNSTLNEGSEFIITIPNVSIDSELDCETIKQDIDVQVNRMNVEFSDIYI